MNIIFSEGDMSRSGGTERMTSLLASQLCKTHSVTVISMSMSSQNVAYPMPDCVKHIPLSPGTLPKKISQIRKIVKQMNADVLINVDTGMGYIGILACLGTKCKTVTWEHSNFYNDWSSKLFPYLRRFAAKHSDAFVTLTERDKKAYISNIKGCAPITVIPNPAYKHELTYDINSKTILSAGLVCKIKRFELIIPTAEKVFAKHPEWCWRLCGDGDELETIKQLAKSSPVADNIIFAGKVSDMDTEYKNAAMYVMTSKNEGLPMVLLEAKSHGLPIVSFDIDTGPSDVITDGVDGYLVPSGDTDILADKICRLIESDDLRRRFSQDSQITMEKFSMETVIAKWQTLLLQITK